MSRATLILCFVLLMAVLLIAACGQKQEEQPAEETPAVTHEAPVETEITPDTAAMTDTTMMEEVLDTAAAEIDTAGH